MNELYIPNTADKKPVMKDTLKDWYTTGDLVGDSTSGFARWAPTNMRLGYTMATSAPNRLDFLLVVHSLPIFSHAAMSSCAIWLTLSRVL